MFEQTYIAPESSVVPRGILVAAFFDWLGDRYAVEIDPHRNCSCYEFLFKIAKESTNARLFSSLLDVGCGPATVLTTGLRSELSTIVGYDIGVEVRRSAVTAGLPVMTRDEFFNGNSQFDIALSSYVMHYGCDVSATVRAVGNHLKPEGLWVANFHKSINLQLLIDSLPESNLHLTATIHHPTFGTIVTLSRDITETS